MSAARDPQQTAEPPCLATALALLGEGLWPVALYPGEKAPIGQKWGLERPTEALLRVRWDSHPNAGVGLKLGCDAGVIDVEIDGPLGEDVLIDALGGELPETRGWSSKRGHHYLFRWDDRLKRYGKTIIHFGPDDALELRIGALEPGGQFQSVVPPTSVDGFTREWNGIKTIAPIPDALFEHLDNSIPIPGSANRLIFPIWESAPGRERPAAEARAAAWLGRRDPAISGQRGHDQLFGTACAVGPGFNLPPEAAYRVLKEVYNPTCVPPWSDKELWHKVTQAYRKETRRGWKLEDSNNTDKTAKTDETGGREAGFVSNGSFVSQEQKSEDWEPPVEPTAESVALFPLEVFPEPLRDLCRVGSDVMHAPVDFFAAAALGLAGGVIGRSVVLKVTTTWEVMPNLFVAIVANPGSKKSPVLMLMSRALRQIDRDLRDAYKAERAEWDSRDGDEKGDAPTMGHLTLDDATREAFASTLADNPRGLVLIKDELTAWVASLNAYRSGKGDDKQFWLSLNSGSPVKVNRKGAKNEPIVVPHPCASIVGCLTPSTLPTMRAEQVDDGWLDRILFSYPEPLARLRRWSDQQIPEELLTAWSNAVMRLWNRSMRRDLDRVMPHVIEMTPGAREVWAKWFNDHNDEMADPDFPPSLIGPWSKLEGFCLRFALILAQLREAFDLTHAGPPRPVEDIEVFHATKLAAYFKNHFKRSRTAITGRRPWLSHDAERVLRYVRSHGQPTVLIREIGRTLSLSEEDRDAALAELAKRRYMRPLATESRPQGGRKVKVWEVSPHVLNQTDKTAKTDETCSATAAGAVWGKPERWLFEWLLTGEWPVASVIDGAAQAGISETRLRQAALTIGVETIAKDGKETWRWVERA